MKESCGFLYKVFFNKYLIVHPTKGDHWSIPKGVREEGETALQAAIRELKEETGQTLTGQEDIRFLGRFKYTHRKDLTVFEVDGTMSFDESTLKCGTLIDKTNLPEVDKYSFVYWDELLECVNPSQRKVLEQIRR